MQLHPADNYCLGQGRQPLLVADAAAAGEQPGQRRAALQPTQPDAEGNVHIDAPGYTVKRVDARTGDAVEGARTLQAPAHLTRRYWLATEVSPAGLAGYELDVYWPELRFAVELDV